VSRKDGSPGRPRSEAARRAIHDAVFTLLAEGGYGRLTIDRIARTAGVSRQTVYRWWPTKAAVVLEALNDLARAVVDETDVPAFVHATVIRARDNARVLTGLMAEAQLDEEFAATFRRDFLLRRRAVLHDLLAREGVPDPDFGAELVYAALWYRLLTGPEGLTPDFADQLLDMLRRHAAPGCAADAPPR
jgi:AcrR family transcriptional regulator